MRENRLKDPFRVKKSVKFTIALTPSDDEGGVELNSEDEEEVATIIAEASPSGSREGMRPKKSPKKSQKILVVGANDEVEDQEIKRGKKALNLSKE